MVSQKDIAQALGITQAAVSMALRGDRTISNEMKRKVCDTAVAMGYQLNEHVSALMSNIRTGKKLNDKGVIGLLIAAQTQEDWYTVKTFQRFHQGVLRRGSELGFHIESFFLLDPGMRAARIDQILYARGIDGIILAPPGRGKDLPDLQWERYASVVASIGWEGHSLNRVYCDQFQNYVTAFNTLLQLGYKRIGTSLEHSFVQGPQRRTKWHTGYLECQHNIPEEDRIPVFTYNSLPLRTGLPKTEVKSLHARFSRWVSKWKPEVLITLLGGEKKFLDAMKLKIPQDIGLVCLAQPSDSDHTRIDEKMDVLGVTALELVAAQIVRNEFGPPAHPKVTMIAGQWKDGSTVQNRNRTTTVSARCPG